MSTSSSSSAAAAKFDPARAAEYAVQSRIALAGYDACHELAACLLAASLGRDTAAHLLIVGVGGTAQEVLCAAPLAPHWRFTAIDPSTPMLDLARTSIERASIETAGLTSRVTLLQATVENLPATASFDAATLIGVLHHQSGDAAKHALLSAIAQRLKPGAPLILAGNRHAYASRPLFLAAWGERWRQHGASEDEVTAKLGKILQGADPPASDEAVADLLAEAGFEPPQQFFTSLFWGAWLTRRLA
jgi:tRNA (cmo5U34)-methyltransferase